MISKADRRKLKNEFTMKQNQKEYKELEMELGAPIERSSFMAAGTDIMSELDEARFMDDSDGLTRAERRERDRQDKKAALKFKNALDDL